MDWEKLKNRKSKRESGLKAKSQRQEKSVAGETLGKTTIASGALPFDKGDVRNKELKVRIECKRTDKSQITIKKRYLQKIVAEARNEIPVLHIELGEEKWYVIQPGMFAYILEKLQEK